MFWNGTRWTDSLASETPSTASRRRARDWIATGVMITGIIALAIPFVATNAASRSPNQAIAAQWGPSAGRGGHQHPKPTAAPSPQPTRTPKPTPTPTPTPFGPTISAVRASAITQKSAQISWSVNEPTTGQVEYGLTSGYGSMTAPDLSLTSSLHTQQVAGLDAGALYHYRVKSRDAAGYTSVSADFTLTTLAPSLSPSPSATPSPSPSATPSPSPSATPSPSPSPSASPSPSPSPVGVTVPASIDATCATNASPALNAWIAAQQNGSTLIFPAGSCYQLGGDAGLNLTGRTGLSLIGTGSTLQLRTSGATNFSSAFFLQNSTHILVRGFAVDGGNPATGTTAAGSAVNEHMNAAVIRAGCSFIEFDHVTWDRLRGFGPLLSADGGTTWPTNISIHDSVIRGGEMGIGIVAARNVQIVHNAINDSVDSAIDLEPDSSQSAGGGFQNVLISNNDVTNYGWGQTLTSWFVAANPQDAVLATATMDGLTIDGNRVHIGAATANNGNADGLGGLGIRADKSNRKTNVVITNNTTTDDDTRPSSTAVINLANVENLTVTGNRQPTASGAALLRDTGTTGTRTVSGNNIAL